MLLFIYFPHTLKTDVPLGISAVDIAEHFEFPLGENLNNFQLFVAWK